jgi:Glycosyltransferase family 92
VSQSVYLAACAIFRDEAAYLSEWLAFHRAVGVEHFFLYDNLSADSSQAVLEPWVRAGLVTFVEASSSFGAGAQARAYADALERARDRARWLAFIDIDEFLFTPERDSLSEVLVEYERHPGVVANWQIYGSSDFETRPPGFVIENFVQRARTTWVRNRRVKSIVDPARTNRSIGPHFFEYARGELAATENHEPVRVITSRNTTRRFKRRLERLPVVDVDPFAIHRSSVGRVSVRRLRINHYAVKSKQEFTTKIARHAQSDNGAGTGPRVACRYFTYHDRNEVRDPILCRHLPRLAAVLDGLPN